MHMFSDGMVLLQYGNKEEVAKLRGLFPSKTSAAPPSKEALAAMGEDGSGLSRESMLRKLWPFRPASSSNPPSNGKTWSTDVAGGTPWLKGPRALHATRLAPAPRILV